MATEILPLSKESDPHDIEIAAPHSEEVDHGFIRQAQPPSSAGSLRNFFTPEILRRPDTSRGSLRRTAYLDGIRGFAAWIVYLAHNLLTANSLFSPIEVAFGYEGKNRYLINLPFLRILFTGSHVAVPIFFVISGYVQARKPIQQLLERQDISGTLSSAILRRPFRLYTPFIGSTLSFIVLWHAFNITPTLNHHEPTLLGDIWHYMKDLWYWTYIFRNKNRGYFTDHQRVQEGWSDYNGHSWTIPIELQGSIIVYVFLLALSKATSRARIMITSLAAVYFLIHGAPYVFTFLMGSVLAELDLTSSRDFLISSTFPYRTQVFCLVLVLGTYIGAPPALGLLFMSSEMLAQQPGFVTISKFVPWVYPDVTQFLVAFASILIIVPIMAVPAMRRPFEARIWQYFGRISFSLYLVHGPVLETLGVFMYTVVGKKVPETVDPWFNVLPVPKIGPLGIDLPFIVANAVILPVTLYAAELCMKLFDDTSVWIAKSAYESIVA